MKKNTTPVSKSQERAIQLLGLLAAPGYDAAAEVLEAAGFCRTGIPAGHTWRSAQLLDGATLVAQLSVEGCERERVEWESARP